jgi:unsaturated chondroitin disaccharide hydrolase
MDLGFRLVVPLMGVALAALACSESAGSGTQGGGAGSGGVPAGGASPSGSGGDVSGGTGAVQTGGGPGGGAPTGGTGGTSSGSGGARPDAGSGGAYGGMNGGAGSDGAGQGGTSPGGSAGTGGAGAGAGGGAGSGASGAAGAGGMSHAVDAAFCRQELSRAAEHYQGFRGAYTDPMRIPRSAQGGTVRTVTPSDWTSGFPAGTFWLLYDHTQQAAYRTAAESWTQALEGQRTRTSDHDIGFIINCTFGNGYRLTQNAAYLTVITRAAQSLATRFNATVGATRSWDFGSWSFPVIIDNMMNLELLLNATKLGGDMRYAQMAVTHALTTDRNHFRSDASSYHVVDYNASTGAVVRKQTNQGLADESAWARGQAWGLYGYTMMYRETRDQRFLARALAIADFYTGHARMPSDGVPYFDFDAPVRSDVPDHRDASAGAIAASGLFELAGFASGAASERYLAFAIRAARSLSSASYRAALGANSHFLLMHSVGNYPQSDEVDVAMNYADYYYVEALLRCSKLP